MKYNHTPEKHIKQHPDTGVYYFKRGQIELSLKTTDFKTAKLRADVKLDEIDSAGSAAFRHTVKILVQEYIEFRAKDEDIRKVTYDEIVAMMNGHLLPFFGKYKLNKVTPVLWIKYCASKDLDLANHRKVMRGFLKWCVDKGYLLGQPDISRIPKHTRRKRRIVKPTELEAIFTAARGSVRLLAALALYNGMRRTEIMTLKWAGVNLDERHLTIASESNKLGRGRSIPFNMTIRELLIQRQDEQARDGIKTRWVFPNARDPKRHGDVAGLKKAWARALKTANLRDITWHDLRATYEKWAHMSLDHTDTQKEKFADSSSEVQKRIYVSMDHADLKGLEDVVRVPGLDSLIIDSGRTRGSK